MKEKQKQVAVAATLVAIFCVGALGYWFVGMIEQQAILFEDDTLQKLTYCAQINSNQAEGYSRALLAIQAASLVLRNRYYAEAREFERKNDASIELYRDSLTSEQPDSQRNLDEMLVLRERYRESLDRVFSLLSQNQTGQALSTANDDLWPAYRRYTDQGDVLLAHDVAVGKERAQMMRALTMKVKFVAATLCILVFLVGLIAPFLFLVGVVNWMEGRLTSERGC